MQKISCVKTNSFYIEKYTLKNTQANMNYLHSFELYYIVEDERGISLVIHFSRSTSINTIRIKATFEFLKTEDLFLSEIAIYCSFNSTPYFCNVFKDENGVSPSEYRNSAK